MAIKITGRTDASGALIALQNTTKSVCLVCTGGTGGTGTVKTLLKIGGSADAADKLGTDCDALELINILINNGVSDIRAIMVGTEETPALKYAAALSVLMSTKDIDIIIVDVVETTVTAEVKTHLNTAEAEDLFRLAVVGVSDASSNATLTNAAGTLNHKRMFMPGPALTSGATTLSGAHTAAALAALIATETDDPALPMNSVTMEGFTGLSRTLLTADKDALVAGGVTPLYMSDDGRPAVHRLVTTYTKNGDNEADPTWQEGTTILVTDDVMRAVQERLKANYKRTKKVARILNSIRTDVVDVLQRKNDLEIIENFDPKTVSVVQSSTDLYGAEVDYTYDVVTPLYTISITQHMVL